MNIQRSACTDLRVVKTEARNLKASSAFAIRILRAVLGWFGVLCWASLGVLPLGGTTAASTSPLGPEDICDHAAELAARDSGVPVAILKSLTRTETGRNRNGRLEPWPWTVNMEGAGRWFADQGSAQAFVLRHHERGARSFDVGCFQINYKWHGQAFASPDAMFDPLDNAQYAAIFMARLYQEFGDWSRAAGAFHSRTQDHSKTYRARFDRILSQLETSERPHLYIDAQAEGDGAIQAQQHNRFPLLQQDSGAVALGSLVPLKTGQTSALISFVEGQNR